LTIGIGIAIAIAIGFAIALASSGFAKSTIAIVIRNKTFPKPTWYPGETVRNLPVLNPDCTAEPDEGMKALALLENFFAAVDRGESLPMPGHTAPTQLREALHRALLRLLIWDRPYLQGERGLLWPLAELAKRTGVFEAAAASASRPEQRRQARLFLALLPFPGQWRRLDREADRQPLEPEVAQRLRAVASKAAVKVRSRAKQPLRIRNICQVIKPYHGPQEKGILRIFSIPYLFASDPLLELLSSRYLFYVEPAMGVMFRHGWGRAFGKLHDPCVFGMPGADDRQFLTGQDNIVPVPIAHGDFLEDIDPPPRPTEPRFDLVFNATFDDPARKRHQLMLELLLRPELRQATALFLGRGEESAVADFSRRVQALDLDRRVSVAANVRRGAVPEYLAQCKIGVHLSLNENGCRCIPEFFRSDLPCVVSSAMAGLDFSMINEATGRAATDPELASAITATLGERARFQPRRWFLQNCGSRRATARLNTIFRELFAAHGYRWSEDLVPLTGSGASRYAVAADYQRFVSEFQWILYAFQHLGPLPLKLILE